MKMASSFMKKYFKYNWHVFHLNTKCQKCGNNIPVQDVEEQPTCNECGHVNKISWAEIIQTADIEGMKRGGSSKKTMLGTIDATLQFDKVNEIKCHHCKSVLEFNADDNLSNYQCPSCHQSLKFTSLPMLPDFLFYKSGNSVPEGIKMVAVRCVSCGAPLEVDPTKNQFNCKFCSTDNILPMSMRYKVVLDDLYFGEKVNRYPKLLAFDMNGHLVKQSLRENGRSSFEDAELDQVLLNQKNDLEIYNTILGKYNYLPSDKILNELFNSSNNQLLVGQVGIRLQKSKEEIDGRINEITPKKTPAKNQAPHPLTTKQVKSATGFKKNWPYAVLFLIMLALWLYFGTSIFR